MPQSKYPKPNVFSRNTLPQHRPSILEICICSIHAYHQNLMFDLNDLIAINTRSLYMAREN